MQALEGLGESQAVRSQEIDLSSSDLAGDAAVLDDKEKDIFSRTNGGSNPEFLDVARFSLQDEGWISPPNSIYSSSPTSGVTSDETSLPDSFNGQENVMEQFSGECNGGEPTYYMNSIPLSGTNIQEKSSCEQSESQYVEVRSSGTNSAASVLDEPSEHLQALALPKDEAAVGHVDPLRLLDKEKSQGVIYGGKDDAFTSNQVKKHIGNHESPLPNTDGGSRISRGKNQICLSSPPLLLTVQQLAVCDTNPHRCYQLSKMTGSIYYVLDSTFLILGCLSSPSFFLI